MKTELDEKFKIVNTKSRKEYLEKIDAFLNQYKKFRPYVNPTYEAIGMERQNKDLFAKYDLNFLDSKFFFKGNVYTNSYNFLIAYSKVLDKNVIIARPRWSFYDNFIITSDSDDYRITIAMVRRLYKKLVLDIIDPANILREIKQTNDKAFEICKSKYHFSGTKGSVLESVNYDSDSKLFHINYSSFGIKNYITFYNEGTYNCTFSPQQIVQQWGRSTHSNDFENDIKPLISETIKKNIDTMTIHNEERMAQVICS